MRPAIKRNRIGSGISIARGLYSRNRVEILRQGIGPVHLQTLAVSVGDAHLQRVVPGVVAGMPHAYGVEIRIRFLLSREYQPAVDRYRIDIVQIRNAGKIDSP